MAALDLRSLLGALTSGGGSLAGLSRLASGGRAPSAPAADGPEGLTGPALERYWNQQADAQDAADIAAGDDLAHTYAAGGNIGMSIDQGRANLMNKGNLMRERGMPATRGFLASLAGKKVSGLGQPGFQEGRIAPGTTDVVEGIGPTWHDWQVANPSTDPNTIAGRSGLSQQALRLLMGG